MQGDEQPHAKKPKTFAFVPVRVNPSGNRPHPSRIPQGARCVVQGTFYVYRRSINAWVEVPEGPGDYGWVESYWWRGDFLESAQRHNLPCSVPFKTSKELLALMEEEREYYDEGRRREKEREYGERENHFASDAFAGRLFNNQ
jgi:hypothetical protein